MAPKELLISCLIPEEVAQVWECYSNPKHVVHWNAAHESWTCPKAENDLKPGGRFNYRMEAKDGSFGFDFTGVYNEIALHEVMNYTLDDGRKVRVKFVPLAGKETQIEIVFEAESENSLELQQQGWQAILDNFRNYVVNLKA
jgi:uncharacterized protein YndB with AHSA1/START domain